MVNGSDTNGDDFTPRSGFVQPGAKSQSAEHRQVK
jgi:hypothetical protein